MLRGYKYRLYPNLRQQDFLNRSFGCARYIYNWALNKKTPIYKETSCQISAYDLSANLTIFKREEGKEWLKDVPAVCLQQAIMNMDRSFKNFFRGSGFPKFRSKYGKQRIQFPQGLQVNLEESKIRLPGSAGWAKIAVDRRFKGKIKTTTVSKTSSGKYFVSILIETEDQLPQKKEILESTTIGIDVGLTHFAILSDGTKIDNPRHFKKAEKRLAVLQRRHARKKKGSNRRELARIKVAKHHEKVANQRKDFLQKLSTELVKNHDSLAIESLNVEGMLKNRRLSKAIQGASWSEFFRMLEYKCSWSGKNLLKIGRFEPSSKMCTCGVKNVDLTIKDRVWACTSCGETHDRDILAANNIKRWGISALDAEGELRDSGRVSAGEDVEMSTLVGSTKRQHKLGRRFLLPKSEYINKRQGAQLSSKLKKIIGK